MSTATTRSGSIAVETTEQGLPLRISIEAAELRREPAELAAELLRLCARAADRAGLARRRQLAEAGVSSDLLALTGLPTAEQVERQALIDEQEYDTEPQSWLRSV
ncbi:hypothetical protein NONO_c09310 [Nocardia nova SH22a]|uniref:Uncharacterized protein n=1 Tax=Nocardia nova SH22a TaxID=1415166 RepID=W5T9Q4_9NOCA|nr:hypothetical protein [Nocardia nova]AHH15738.1 hypothetical protein NONO_c09310 [Nocardia nova SH22a]